MQNRKKKIGIVRVDIKMLLAGGKESCELCGLLQHEEKSDIYIQSTLNIEGGFSSVCVCLSFLTSFDIITLKKKKHKNSLTTE